MALRKHPIRGSIRLQGQSSLEKVPANLLPVVLATADLGTMRGYAVFRISSWLQGQVSMIPDAIYFPRTSRSHVGPGEGHMPSWNVCGLWLSALLPLKQTLWALHLPNTCKVLV